MGGWKLPRVGDVITSLKFAFGRYEDESKEIIVVDGKTKKWPVGYRVEEEERVALAARTGKIGPRTITVELGAYDLSRADAEFVVEFSGMLRGGIGDRDCFLNPDYWYIRARRLDVKGTYNPEGEVICFDMTGRSNCVIEPEDVKIVGKKELRFV